MPRMVAKSIHESSGSPKLWTDLLADDKELSDKTSRAKKCLNRDAASKMTLAILQQSDTAGDISGGLERIHDMLT